jgi:Ca2+-transporting ATPase
MTSQIIDVIVNLATVLATAILGFVEEFRSEKAMEASRKMTAPAATVLRDGKELRIPASEIVPGDVIPLARA